MVIIIFLWHQLLVKAWTKTKHFLAFEFSFLCNMLDKMVKVALHLSKLIGTWDCKGNEYYHWSYQNSCIQGDDIWVHVIFFTTSLVDIQECFSGVCMAKLDPTTAYFAAIGTQTKVWFILFLSYRAPRNHPSGGSTDKSDIAIVYHPLHTSYVLLTWGVCWLSGLISSFRNG